MSLNQNHRPSTIQLYKRPRLSSGDSSSSDVYSNVKKTAENLMLQQASWKTESGILSKRLDEAKRIIQEQQKRIGALSEMKGELNGIVTEQRKALERLKFGAVEAETLHGATKEQITKALTFVKEGKEDREKIAQLLNTRFEEFQSLKNQVGMLEKELTETKDQLFEARQSNKRETELSASLQKELEFKETESNLLKQNLEDLAISISNLEEQKGVCEVSIKELETEICSLKQEISKQLEILRNSEMQAADEKETQTKAAQDMAETISLQKLKVAAMADHLAKVEEKLEASEAKNLIQSSECNRLTQSLEELMERYKIMEEKESQLCIANEQFSAKIRDLSQSVIRITEQLSLAQQLNEELQTSCEEKDKALDNLKLSHQANVTALESKLSSSETKKAELKEMFEESQQSLQKLKGENQEFGEVVEHLNEEIKKGKESLAEKECVLMEADKQLSEFETQYEEAILIGNQQNHSIAELTEAKKELEQRVNEKDQFITAIREQFDLEKGALTNRIQEIEKDSQHQLQEVKKENEDLSCKLSQTQKMLENQSSQSRKDRAMIKPSKEEKVNSDRLQRTQNRQKNISEERFDRNIWSEEDSEPVPFARPSKRVTHKQPTISQVPKKPRTYGKRTTNLKKPEPKKIISSRERSIFSEDEDLF